MFSIIDDIILLNYIDSGCFAEIYLSKKKDSNTLFATKKIGLKYISVEPLFKTHLQNEINYLKSFDHPNIIKLYDVKVTQQDIYLVMEYCNGGSLKKVLNNYQLKYGKPFSEEIVQYFMKQILKAVEYLHNLGIVHRDLKLENILLKYNDNIEHDLNNFSNFFSSQIKLIDFNISINSEKNKNNRTSKINDELGVNVCDIIDEKFDIWHLGLLCYEMLIGDKLLPEGYNIKQLYTVSIPQNISLSAQTFLLSMLQINKEKRLSCTQLLKHEFITNNKNSAPIEFDIPSEFNYKSEKKVINNLNISSNIPLDNFRKKNMTISTSDDLRLSCVIPHRRLPSIFEDNNNEKNNEKNNVINNKKNNTNNNINNNVNKLKEINIKKENRTDIYATPRKTETKKFNMKKYICTINTVGKNIKSDQLKVIVDSCVKTYLQMNGKIMTANKAANMIKKSLGENWLVFISNNSYKDFDFCLSPGKKENYVCFVFCDKLFQVFQYN